MSIFQNKKNTSWTLIISLFLCPSITEMMIRMMMKVIQTSTICTNMEYSHSEIIHRCNFGSKHLINARLSSETSLQYQADSYSHDAAPQCLNSNNINSDHGTEDTIKTFPTMLKLISGTLVGGVKYSDIYIDSDEDEDTSSTNDYVNNNDKGQDKTQHKIPTLPQIAQKAARLEKTQLDEKQYIAYEMIACTFLLGLVNDGRDKNTK
jgi:hypothetical protein